MKNLEIHEFCLRLDLGGAVPVHGRTKKLCKYFDPLSR